MDDCSSSCEEKLNASLGSIDFSTFVISLGTSALYHLGANVPEAPGATTVNLPMARNIIDIIVMLKEKTAGNLTDDEVRLLEALLFDLRLKYVETCGKSSASSPETSTSQEPNKEQ
ncbi:MAG TPA: DUF1844 domain-containing protein [Myxococcota bacterium]|nr:DUF1844 domain-containing protein [Myxococcota bacterium]HNZ03072.1 DUF1844 domain-containing protein [Myxococcota bacterium]HNZ03161.1 DUF1844 domain-containing protein [Myxococcota bacterium]HOC99089.1 DUF1844 domain-containing protein [Myxococcota bacterium]HOH77115.1 DUF1844 domain-containing protein [Myxococcota bacterium]